MSDDHCAVLSMGPGSVLKMLENDFLTITLSQIVPCYWGVSDHIETLVIL